MLWPAGLWVGRGTEGRRGCSLPPCYEALELELVKQVVDGRLTPGCLSAAQDLGAALN